MVNEMSRSEFVGAINYARRAGVLSVYARFGAFGRVLILATGERYTYAAWTNRPNLNVHRAALAR